MISIEQIPAPLRRLGRYAGYPAFAILVAIVSLYFSLPRDVIRDRIEMALSADPKANPPGLGMDVTIGDADLTLLFGPGVSLTDIQLKTRPTVPGEKPTRFVIDDLTFRTGLLGQLFRSPSYSFKTHVLAGELRGDIAIGKNLEVDINADKLVLTGAPGARRVHEVASRRATQREDRSQARAAARGERGGTHRHHARRRRDR